VAIVEGMYHPAILPVLTAVLVVAVELLDP